jgi:hypothetical protein
MASQRNKSYFVSQKKLRWLQKSDFHHPTLSQGARRSFSLSGEGEDEGSATRIALLLYRTADLPLETAKFC